MKVVIAAIIIIGIVVFLSVKFRKIEKYSPPVFQFPYNPTIVSDARETDPTQLNVPEMSAPQVNKIDHVINNIYISNWMMAINEEQLVKNNIKFIICLNKEFKKNIKTMEMYKRLGINQLYIDIADHPSMPIKSVFDKIYNYIEAAQGQNVLIHCSMGISRSACAVVSYLMKKLRNENGKPVSLEQAYSMLKGKRPVVNINPGFLEQLKQLEQNLGE